MSPEEIQERLHNLEQQIINSYKHASILDDVCTLQPVTPSYQRGEFTQFANRFEIERGHILDGTYMIISELGLEVARSEISLLIDEFTKQSPSKKIKKFSIVEIAIAVQHLESYHYKPTVIFIPKEYFEDVWEWNKKFLVPPSESWDHLAVNSVTILKVIYSSEYAKFNDIIITSQPSNIWRYRPDERTTDERLTARFHWGDSDDPINTLLEIKTVFNFEIKPKEANVILKLPHSEGSEE